MRGAIGVAQRIAGGRAGEVGSVAVFEAPAGIAGLDDIAVVSEPVEHGGCHLGVAEHGRVLQFLTGSFLRSRSQTRIISCLAIGFQS